MLKQRPDWDIYFSQIASVVATRSTCLRRSVGAVLVKNRQILSTGYNGAPKKISSLRR
ncbi:MAG: deoxycytidylate deaminase [Synergistaceae bacterium]